MSLKNIDFLSKKDLASYEVVIGFDFGHGEFSLSEVNAVNNETPLPVFPYDNKISDITAISVQPTNDEVLAIGEAAIRSVNSISDHLQLNFKNRPNISDKTDKLLMLFFKGVIQKIISKKCNHYNKKLIIYVGCPVEWRLEDGLIDKYCNLFQTAITQLNLSWLVRVIPESRAAIKSCESNNIINGDDLLNKNSLLVDFGSSTVDISLLSPYNDKDCGANLGAFLWDQLIFLEVMQKSQNCSQLVEMFNVMPGFMWRSILKCRKLKENFSNAISINRKNNIKSNVINRPYAGEREHYIDSNGKFVCFDPIFESGSILEELVFQRPLKSISEISNKIGLNTKFLFLPPSKYLSFSYKDALKEFFNEVCVEFPKPDKLVLSGGASHMYFLFDEVIKPIFNFERTIILFHPRPQIAVSDGLARRGKSEIQCSCLIGKLKDSLNDIITEIVDKNYSTLTELVSNKISGVLTSNTNIFYSHLIKYGGGDIGYNTSKQVAEKCKKSVINWFDGNEYIKIMDSVFENWLKKTQITTILNQKIQSIAKELFIIDNSYNKNVIGNLLSLTNRMASNLDSSKFVKYLAKVAEPDSIIEALTDASTFGEAFVAQMRDWGRKYFDVDTHPAKGLNQDWINRTISIIKTQIVTEINTCFNENKPNISKLFYDECLNSVHHLITAATCDYIQLDQNN